MPDPHQPVEPEPRRRPLGERRDRVSSGLRMQGFVLVHLVRWVALGSVVGVLAGLSSAGFLITLDWVTEIRLPHPWLLWLLPLAGLGVGLVSHYAGGDAIAGNN